MLLDGTDASYIDLDDPTYLDFSYVRRIGDAIDVAWPEGKPVSALHLGGAGATLPRRARATSGPPDPARARWSSRSMSGSSRWPVPTWDCGRAPASRCVTRMPG